MCVCVYIYVFTVYACIGVKGLEHIRDRDFSCIVCIHSLSIYIYTYIRLCVYIYIYLFIYLLIYVSTYMYIHNLVQLLRGQGFKGTEVLRFRVNFGLRMFGRG